MTSPSKDDQTQSVAILARELEARGRQLEACQRELEQLRAAAASQTGQAGELEAELAATRTELAEARERVARFEAELHAVLTSRTWRWSEPTRAAVRLLLGL